MIQLPKSTLGLLIAVPLLCALSWNIWFNRQYRQRTATTSDTFSSAIDQRVLTLVGRPWIRLTNNTLPESLFDFTDSEWQALTNAFADKLSPLVPEQLVFAEGAVTRVSSTRLRELSTSENLQTNAVWFLAP